MELRGIWPEGHQLLARLPHEDAQGPHVQPLDEVRPTRWTQSGEPLRLLAILEHTIEVTLAAALVGEVLASRDDSMGSPSKTSSSPPPSSARSSPVP